MVDTKKKVVIIGGVAGGATAAARLRRLEEDTEIIIIEKGEHISYANCGLPYYVGDQIKDKSNLLIQTPSRFNRRFNIDVRVLSEAINIHPAQKTVKIKNLADNTEYDLAYDKLIISTGAKPIINVNYQPDERIFTLRTIDDAQRIKTFVMEKKPKRVFIAGGGFIGVEMAENLLKQGLQVTIAESGANLLPTLDFDMGAQFQSYVRRYGINIINGKRVKEIKANEKELTVIIDDNTQFTSDIVLLSVGVMPDTSLAAKAGIKTGIKGAIITDEYMQTSIEDIYAIGDAVEITNLITNQKAHIPLASPANKQGRIVADNIAGLKTKYKGSIGSSIVKFGDFTAASTGINENQAKQYNIDYDKIILYPYSHATYYPNAREITLKVIFEKSSGRILGAQAIGQDGVDKRCDVLAAAIMANMTASDLTELELCYAPPFSSAKDPVNMAGYIIENVITGKVKHFHWHDVKNIINKPNTVLLDVRTAMEYSFSHIEGAVNIPVDSLREDIEQISEHKGKDIYVYCQSGLRSYLACRTLAQKGYNCYNLSGGYSLYNFLNTFNK